jgi:hypothetical protein
MTDSFSMALFSPFLWFLTQILKMHRMLSDLFMWIEVSAFGNGGLSEKRNSHASAQRAPHCAAFSLGF